MKPKDNVRRLLDNMPEDATFDDIVSAVKVRQKVTQGLSDIRNGALVSMEDAEQRLSRWIEG
ncbi:MAG TPA: hypothetical protein VGQ76_01220 [Thermoanaerobaculia bacterium]|jgi:hypothetical protein|nr:hypothetical protein [Thermoanaerobaculia bacterium]